MTFDSYEMLKPRLYSLYESIERDRKMVEKEIELQPTGVRRNHLTDVNLNLLGALDALESAMELQ